MTERQESLGFDNQSQPIEDTAFISRDAFEQYKKDRDQKKLWQYIEEYSEESLVSIRSDLELKIETFKGLGKSRPDLRDELLIVRQAIGVRQQIAGEAHAAKMSATEAANDLRRMLAIIEQQPEDGLAERVDGYGLIEQTKQPRGNDDEPLVEIGPQIKVDGDLVDISSFTDAQRRKCVEDLRTKGRIVEEAPVASAAVSAYSESAEDMYFTKADQQTIRDMQTQGNVAATQVEVETTTVFDVVADPSDVEDELDSTARSASVDATSGIPTAEQIGADNITRRTTDALRNINNRFSSKAKILAGVALAAAAVTPLTVSSLGDVPHGISANIDLQLPKAGIEFPGECITVEKYDNAPAKQVVNGVVPFDLKKPDGNSYKFNDDNGTVRIGNDITLTSAEAYVGACEVDEKESALSVDGTTIIIHRDKVKSQLVVTPSSIEGAITAAPVNSDIAKKLEIKDDAIKSKLVGYLEGATFDTLVHNSAMAIAEGIVKNEALHAEFNKVLDRALIDGMKDDIESIAKRSDVGVDEITTELEGEYSQINVLNAKKDVEGAAVMDDLVTVEAVKGK